MSSSSSTFHVFEPSDLSIITEDFTPGGGSLRVSWDLLTGYDDGSGGFDIPRDAIISMTLKREQNSTCVDSRMMGRTWKKPKYHWDFGSESGSAQAFEGERDECGALVGTMKWYVMSPTGIVHLYNLGSGHHAITWRLLSSTNLSPLLPRDSVLGSVSFVFVNRTLHSHED